MLVAADYRTKKYKFFITYSVFPEKSRLILKSISAQDPCYNYLSDIYHGTPNNQGRKKGGRKTNSGPLIKSKFKTSYWTLNHTKRISLPSPLLSSVAKSDILPSAVTRPPPPPLNVVPSMEKELVLTCCMTTY